MKTTSYYLSHVFIGVMHLRPFSHFIILARLTLIFGFLVKLVFNVLTNTYYMKTTFYYLSHVSIGAMHDVVAFQAQGQKIDAYTLLHRRRKYGGSP